VAEKKNEIFAQSACVGYGVDHSHLRQIALDQAIRTVGDSRKSEIVLGVAQQYYEFLTTKA